MSIQLLPDKLTTYLPRTTADGATQNYLNMKLGAMICFNINSFVGSSDKMFTRQIANPNKFSIADVDVKTWAQQLASSGKIKYCYLTVWNEHGFSLYPSRTINDFGPLTISGYPTGGLANMTVPGYQRYNVGVCENADQNIIGKFFAEFKKVGIEPGLYFNSERGYNHTARSAAANYTSEPANGYFRKLQLMEANELYEIFTRYPFKYVWFDSDHTYPINNDIFYNAIKNASPGTIIVHASTPTPTNTFASYRFPYDVKSFEYFAAPGTGTAPWSTTQAYNGVNYYIPKELVTTVLLNEQYYYVNPDYLYDQPSFTVDQLHTQGEVQSYYDLAKANSANFVAGVYADKLGVIPQAQVNLISNITL